VRQWILQALPFTQHLHLSSSASNFSSSQIRKLVAATPFKLIDLPADFAELFQSYSETKCQKCGTVPQEPSLCLVCGRLLCTKSKCCKEGEFGECYLHAQRCSAGVGVFLMVKQSYVLLLKEGSGLYWGSMYLDSHGEEDPSLNRGKPLFLDKQRYEQLRLVWVQQQIDVLCARKRMTHNFNSIVWHSF